MPRGKCCCFPPELLLIVIGPVLLIIFVVHVARMIDRARRWNALAHSGRNDAHLVLRAGRLSALRRIALGTLGMLAAVELDHYVIAAAGVLVMYYGMLDHVFASWAARALANEPTARVINSSLTEVRSPMPEVLD